MQKNAKKVYFFINNHQCLLINGKIISNQGTMLDDSANFFLLIAGEPLSKVLKYNT